MLWEQENYAEVPSTAITFTGASGAKQVGTVESVTRRLAREAKVKSPIVSLQFVSENVPLLERLQRIGIQNSFSVSFRAVPSWAHQQGLHAHWF